VGVLKVGPHAQLRSDGARAWFRVANVGKQLDGTDLLALMHPGAWAVYRDTHVDAINLVTPGVDGAAIARQVLHRLGGFRRRNLVVQFICERYQKRPELERLFDVIAAAVPVFHAGGVQVGVPAWSSGNYTEDEWGYARARRWGGADVVIANGYWSPQKGPTIWNAWRHRQYHDPNSDPPVIYGEIGEDEVRDGDNGEIIGKAGWKANGTSLERFVQGIEAWDAGVRNDPAVIGGVLFGVAPDAVWADRFGADEVAEYFGRQGRTAMPTVMATSTKKESTMPDQWAGVGPGVKAKMQTRGDTPAGPERYIGDWISITFGKKADGLYVYSRDLGQTLFIPGR